MDVTMKAVELLVQHAHACMPRSCKRCHVRHTSTSLRKCDSLHMAGACTLQLLLTTFEGSFTYWGSWFKAWSPAATEFAHQAPSCYQKVLL